MFSSKTLALSVALAALAAGSLRTATAVPISPGAPDYAWLFDEGTGTNAAPIAGGVNGTLSAGATFNSSTPFAYPGNYSVDLDGATGNVNFGANSGFNYVNSVFTASFWIRVPATANRMMLLAKADGPGAGPSSWAYQVELESGTSNLSSGVATGPSNTRYETETLGSNLDNDVWRHVAAILDTNGTGEVRLFVDGLERATTIIQNNFQVNGAYTGAPTIPLRLGARSNGSGVEVPLDGLVDEFALYNRSLTSNEIEWLAANSINEFNPVPEPSTLALLGLGAIGLAIRNRRRSSEP